MISRRILRIKVLQLLYAYYKSTDANLNKVEKELFHSINKTYELYHYLLLLIIEIKDYAAGRIEIARQKNYPSYEDLNPNTKFIENKVIHQIQINADFNNYLTHHKISWVRYPELIRKIYLKFRNSEEYKAYMDEPENSYEHDKEILYHLYTSCIATTDDLYGNLEEQSIYWNDEVEFVISIIIKTIKGFKENDKGNVRLFTLFKNEDDIEFVKRLFRKAILHKEEYIGLIQKYTQHWEIERIAFMDILILQLAITEVIEFESIPTKVTFNEFLEIAKYYSTNKSSIFINGVLDKIIGHLKENNKFKKQGRGLVGEN